MAVQLATATKRRAQRARCLKDSFILVCVLMSVHVHKGPDFIVVGHVDSLDWLDEVCVDVH